MRLGVRLFDRTPRAVTLTDDGPRFHAQIGPLLAAIEEPRTKCPAPLPRYAVGSASMSTPWFARWVLAPRVSEFLTDYPALTLELVVRDTLGDLVREGFDAAVHFSEPEPSSLIARKLMETRILTCAAPAYLARRGGSEPDIWSRTHVVRLSLVALTTLVLAITVARGGRTLLEAVLGARRSATSLRGCYCYWLKRTSRR
jgi:DNA-binding transcriptional LysR family regulator